MNVSIVIPVLNEGDAIIHFFRILKNTTRNQAEIIVVDGGSHDGSDRLAKPFADKFLRTSSGRAQQMNTGASAAKGDLLLFLHADTRLPDNFLSILPNRLDHKSVWGRFDVTLSGRQFYFRLIELLINFRSRWSGIATGDQAIFVRKNTFENVGGFPNIQIMEDIALSKTLKGMARPLCLRDKVVTSSRRWEVNGILSTIFLMWRLRLWYFFGADPNQLAKHYR